MRGDDQPKPALAEPTGTRLPAAVAYGLYLHLPLVRDVPSGEGGYLSWHATRTWYRCNPLRHTDEQVGNI